MKKKLQLFKLNYFEDKRGLLTPFEFINKKIKINNSSLFSIKRMFFVVGNKNYFRGNHAHKKCSQILICLNGKIKIETEYKDDRKIFQMNNKKGEALFIPPMVWNKIYFINKNSSLAVLCDYKYDFKKEYINNYNEFKKLSSKL